LVPISAIKDIIVAVAAIVTAFTALRGLKKWQDELRGKTEYEVARRVIKALYKVKDGFNAVRSAAIWTSEFPEVIQGESRSRLSDTEERKAHTHVYQNRWNCLTEALRELDIEALDAEVIWGQDIEQLMQEIRACRNELQVAIKQYLASITSNQKEANYDADMKLVGKVSDFDGSNDEFSKKIESAIKALEDKMRPHLKH